jgi:predicted amidophosphoribosyltransferase
VPRLRPSAPAAAAAATATATAAATTATAASATAAAALLRAAVGLVAPPSCAACRAPTAGEPVCGPCRRRLPWLRGHRCPRCALPRHRAGCPAAAAAFDRAWAPLAYEGTARDLVVALKFRGALPVAGLMAAHMAANLPLDLRRPSPADSGPASIPAASTAAVSSAPSVAVVPVPAHAGRRRRRGFDPAALLAAGLADRAGLPLSACLRRVDRGARQVGAGRSLRRSAGRFAAVATAPPPPLAVLVDDVHTTGATLDVCARALKEQGARWVGVITYVRTL